MKFSKSTFLALAPALASAHDIHVAARHQNFGRQAAPASSAATSATSAASVPATGASSAASVPGASSSATLAPTATLSISVSLASTNPSAVPTASIAAGAASQATEALFTTATPGAQPTWASNAPALPNPSSLVVANYPPLDKSPPTDSPEVQQWIQEVANSGVQIPDIPPTVAGGCPANPQAVANASNTGWWTCGGYTRDTDIVDCPDKLSWGLTYDDGPGFYTPTLLNYLNQQQLKATFFVVGSRALSSPALLQAEYLIGHQIGVHTWSHPSMTTLSNEAIIAEFGWTKKIIKDVLGVTPNTWRPPFGDIDDRVRAIGRAMGLTPIIWTRISPMATFDTGDFDISGGLTTVGQVLQNWEFILGNATQINNGFIVLEHDLFQQTVDVATGYILPDALAHNPPFKIAPVVTCLNKPMTDAYIELNDNSTNPPAVSASSVVTLSSGAPGSAQATGGVSSSNGAPSSHVTGGDALSALSFIAALAGGASALLF